MLKEILSRIISFNRDEKVDSHFIVNLRFCCNCKTDYYVANKTILLLLLL